MLRVFVDTSIVRYADQERTHLVKQPETFRWGGTLVTAPIVRQVTEHPLEKLNTPQHQHTYEDAKLIPVIDDLAKHGLITLLWHMETMLEYQRNRPFPGPPVPDFIERIQLANCPIYYARMIVSPFEKTDEQLKFLRALKHLGFDEWKRIVGVVADSNNERNQLMDAWHLWSADHNHCEYFLTMDSKLIRSVASRRRKSQLRLVTPSQFLAEFAQLRPAAELERDAWRTLRGT
jgi:hypothetical protein